MTVQAANHLSVTDWSHPLPMSFVFDRPAQATMNLTGLMHLNVPTQDSLVMALRLQQIVPDMMSLIVSEDRCSLGEMMGASDYVISSHFVSF